MYGDLSKWRRLFFPFTIYKFNSLHCTELVNAFKKVFYIFYVLWFILIVFARGEFDFFKLCALHFQKFLVLKSVRFQSGEHGVHSGVPWQSSW